MINEKEENKKLFRNIIEGELRELKKNWPMEYQFEYPWHYIMFHQFDWYHFLSGGLWQLHEVADNYFIWFKMKRPLGGAIKEKDFRRLK